MSSGEITEPLRRCSVCGHILPDENPDDSDHAPNCPRIESTKRYNSRIKAIADTVSRREQGIQGYDKGPLNLREAREAGLKDIIVHLDRAIRNGWEVSDLFRDDTGWTDAQRYRYCRSLDEVLRRLEGWLDKKQRLKSPVSDTATDDPPSE